MKYIGRSSFSTSCTNATLIASSETAKYTKMADRVSTFVWSMEMLENPSFVWRFLRIYRPSWTWLPFEAAAPSVSFSRPTEVRTWKGLSSALGVVAPPWCSLDFSCRQWLDICRGWPLSPYGSAWNPGTSLPQPRMCTSWGWASYWPLWGLWTPPQGLPHAGWKRWWRKIPTEEFREEIWGGDAWFSNCVVSLYILRLLEFRDF